MQLKKNIIQPNYILAVHSSSETLGVAVHNLQDTPEIIKVKTFETGKHLSNNLFKCINELLPYKTWNQIARLAVATGPGGFTGTRLSIAMARTIAQQLECQLDGFSSFSLMAKRIFREEKSININQHFWITSELKRRGLICGGYKIININ